jgi:hypothetical protein
MAGYCFVSTGTAGATDAETGETTATANDIDPLEPSFMFDVPTGTTVLPLEVSLAWEVAGATMVTTIVSDSANRYASGGVAAVAARNLRTNSGYGSVVENLYSGDTAITAAGATAERVHFHYYAFDDIGDAGEGMSFPVVVWVPAVPPVLVGPASFLVYTMAATTGPELRISVTWAEFPSNLIN